MNKHFGVFIFVMVMQMLVFCNKVSAADYTTIDDEYLSYIYEVAAFYNIDPELIIAMVETESAGQAGVVSDAGAIGLMQVVPRWHQARMDKLGVYDLYDPYQNILCGVDLIYELILRYGDPGMALMCYNEGEYGGAVERACRGEYSWYAQKILGRYYELVSMRDEKKKDSGKLLLSSLDRKEEWLYYGYC